eukprot:140490-Chlamydomonas_euryale.AAC.5
MHCLTWSALLVCPLCLWLTTCPSVPPLHDAVAGHLATSPSAPAMPAGPLGAVACGVRRHHARPLAAKPLTALAAPDAPSAGSYLRAHTGIPPLRASKHRLVPMSVIYDGAGAAQVARAVSGAPRVKRAWPHPHTVTCGPHCPTRHPTPTGQPPTPQACAHCGTSLASRNVVLRRPAAATRPAAASRARVTAPKALFGSSAPTKESFYDYEVKARRGDGREGALDAVPICEVISSLVVASPPRVWPRVRKVAEVVRTRGPASWAHAPERSA